MIAFVKLIARRQGHTVDLDSVGDRAALELHGGSIYVDSDGQGATTTLKLLLFEEWEKRFAGRAGKALEQVICHPHLPLP